MRLFYRRQRTLTNLVACFLILITFMSVAPAHATDGPLAARDSSAEQAQTTAAQPQQAVTEAQHVAERASSSVAEAKTALAVVDKQSRDTDKRMCALQETRTLPHR